MALQRHCQGGDNGSNSKLSCERMLDTEQEKNEVHKIRGDKMRGNTADQSGTETAVQKRDTISYSGNFSCHPFRAGE